MKKLKMILLYSFYIISIIYIMLYLKNNVVLSKYNKETKITGIINNFKIKNNYIEIELIAKEKIICFYHNNDIKFKLGDTIMVIGELVKPNKNTNFNLFNYNNYLLSKKIY